MNHPLLNQHLFPEFGSKQFMEALDIFLMTYADVILGFIFIVLLCAAGIALVEARQHLVGSRPLSTAKQQDRTSKHLQTTGYDLFRVEHDSIF